MCVVTDSAKRVVMIWMTVYCNTPTLHQRRNLLHTHTNQQSPNTHTNQQSPNTLSLSLNSHSPWPGRETAERDGLPHGSSDQQLLVQIKVLKLQEVEEVAEEVVQYIRLVHLSNCVPVYGRSWKLQAQPLCGVFLVPGSIFSV